MNCGGMKKILMAIFTLASIPLAWGYDSATVDSFTFSNSKKEKIADASIIRDLGLLYMKINKPGRQYKFAIVKIKDTSADGGWRLVGTTGIPADEASANVAAPDYTKFIIQSNKSTRKSNTVTDLTLQGKTNVFYVAGASTVPATESGYKQKLATDGIFALINMTGAMSFSSGGTLSVSIRMITADNVSDIYCFTWSPEYFKGERALLGQYTKDSYTTKAKSILTQYWPVYGTISSSNTDVTVSKQTLAYAIAHDIVSLYNGNLRGTELKRDISQSKRPLPFKMDDGRLASLVRNKSESPYIVEFFRMNYGIQKTVGSEFVVAVEKAAGYSYDYTDYGFISDGNAIQLAKAALRYYTWGVEYTVTDEIKEKTKSLPLVERTQVNVYEYSPNIVDTWISKSDGSRETNYFGGTIQNKTVPDGINAISAQGSGTGRALLKGLDGLLECIYKDVYGQDTIGNPIPYVAEGRDSPRSFNYKMV